MKMKRKKIDGVSCGRPEDEEEGIRGKNEPETKSNQNYSV